MDAAEGGVAVVGGGGGDRPTSGLGATGESGWWEWWEGAGLSREGPPPPPPAPPSPRSAVYTHTRSAHDPKGEAQGGGVTRPRGGGGAGRAGEAGGRAGRGRGGRGGGAATVVAVAPHDPETRRAEPAADDPDQAEGARADRWPSTPTGVVAGGAEKAAHGKGGAWEGRWFPFCVRTAADADAAAQAGGKAVGGRASEPAPLKLTVREPPGREPEALAAAAREEAAGTGAESGRPAGRPGAP